MWPASRSAQLSTSRIIRGVPRLDAWKLYQPSWPAKFYRYMSFDSSLYRCTTRAGWLLRLLFLSAASLHVTSFPARPPYPRVARASRVSMSGDGGASFHTPAALRNRGPILDFLQSLPWPSSGHILEVASGTGPHVGLFAGSEPFSSFTWQPTDFDPEMLPFITAEVKARGLRNVKEPVMLDVRSDPGSWPCAGPAALDCILAINLLHISPYECTRGLLRASGVLLKPGGHLVTYGPYKINGVIEPESNVAFDTALRSRNPEWGLRELNEIEAEARAQGLVLSRKDLLPANNYALAFTKDGGN